MVSCVPPLAFVVTQLIISTSGTYAAVLGFERDVRHILLYGRDGFVALCRIF